MATSWEETGGARRSLVIYTGHSCVSGRIAATRLDRPAEDVCLGCRFLPFPQIGGGEAVGARAPSSGDSLCQRHHLDESYQRHGIKNS